MMSKKLILFFALFTHFIFLHSQRQSLLPYSKGPGPLFSFGLNVQPKNSLIYRQIYMLDERDITSRLVLHNHLYYGLSDHFTFVLKQPVILKRRNDGKHTRGLGNIHIQIETIPYVYEIPNEFRFRITTVTGAVPPTTTVRQNTQLTLHSTSCFLGITQSNTTPRVFQYAGLGIFITTNDKKFNNGSRLYYQLGFAHAIINNENLYLGIDFEMSGEYQQSRTINGVKDFTTGSNMIFYGYSFRASTEYFIGQIGIQYPWIQHLKSVPQNPTNYRLAVAGALHFSF